MKSRKLALNPTAPHTPSNIKTIPTSPISPTEDQSPLFGMSRLERLSTKEHVDLSAIQELNFAMLWWRSIDFHAPNPILGDTHAESILGQCEIDMSKPYYVNDKRLISYICNRAKTLDKWCQRFIDTYAESEPVQVVHLGCGLDTRNLRVDWMGRGPESVRWFDVDFPAICDLRERVLPPEDATCTLEKGYSLRRLDISDKRWYRDIPSDRRTLIVAETVVYFLPSGSQARTFFAGLVEYFGTGEFAIDTIGKLLIRHKPTLMRNTTLTPTWGVDEPHEIETLVSPRGTLRLLERIRWEDYLGSNAVLGQSAPPFYGFWTSALWSVQKADALRNGAQVLRFEFGNGDSSTNLAGSSGLSVPNSVSSGSHRSA